MGRLSDFLDCKWGWMELIKDESGEHHGYTAPLWVNSFPKGKISNFKS